MPTLEVIEQLAKRRGFFYPSSEIYGGLSGLYDYGHLGVLMKRKIEDSWRKYFLDEENFYEVDPSTIMHEKVFEASGHLKSFVDPVARCKVCHTTHRADFIVEEFLKQKFTGMTPMELQELIKEHKVRCTNCGGELEEVGVLNLMFPLDVGLEKKGYLRPETAQGVYVNFQRQFEVLRKRLPLGLAIVGKAFRNEISPRQLTIRMREFTQAELQIFFDPEKPTHEDFISVKKYELILLPATKKKQSHVEIAVEDAVKKFGLSEIYAYYLAKIQKFFLEKLMIPKAKFRFRELDEEERAFYNKTHWDIELKLGSLQDFKEVGGLHYRADHDLSGHEKISKQSQEIFFEEKKFIPHVLELSFGIDRILFSLLDIFYEKEKDRTLLKLPSNSAPITVSVFPLVNKDGLDKKAKEVHKILKKELETFYDDSGSIGRMYARSDEIGTPFAVTIDFETKKDDTVTVRERDSKRQHRVKIDSLINFIEKKFS